MRKQLSGSIFVLCAVVLALFVALAVLWLRAPHDAAVASAESTHQQKLRDPGQPAEPRPIVEPEPKGDAQTPAPAGAQPVPDQQYRIAESKPKDDVQTPSPPVALPTVEARETAKTEVSPPTQAKTHKYDFEGPLEWEFRIYRDTMACSEVVHSDRPDPKGARVEEIKLPDRIPEEKATSRREALLALGDQNGGHALEMKMDLVGQDEAKSSGEAFVALGDDIAISLKGKIVSALIYAPKGSLGWEKSPNGFQVFVKDENFNCEYGPWYNIDWEDRWFPVFLEVSDSKPKGQGSYIDPGFDQDSIIEIGIKMGAGGKSTTTYKGSVYVDDVDW